MPRLSRVGLSRLVKDTDASPWYTDLMPIDKWNKLGDEIVGNAGQEFGTSLDISESGNAIIVGTPMEDYGDKKSQAGSVWVYVRDNVSGKTRWLVKGNIIYGD